MYSNQFLTEIDFIVARQDSSVTAETRMLFDSLKGKAEYFFVHNTKRHIQLSLQVQSPDPTQSQSSITLIYGWKDKGKSSWQNSKP